jgi:hypothetical protein
MLLDFISTVLPGVSVLDINSRDSYSLSDLYTFRNGASSSTKSWSIIPCGRYVCLCLLPRSISASISALPRCSGHYGFCAQLSLHYVRLHSYKAYRGFLSKQACGVGYALVYITLLWQGPEAIVQVNYRPVLSSERAIQNNNAATV